MSFLKNIFGKKTSPKTAPNPEEVKAEASQSGATGGHDFSHVDSLEKAQALAASGELTPLYIFPVELGGQEIPLNTVYVPPATIAVQQQLVGTITRFVEEGLIDNFSANAEYKGKSFVPSQIHMQTTHGDKPGAFNPSIEIW